MDFIWRSRDEIYPTFYTHLKPGTYVMRYLSTWSSIITYNFLNLTNCVPDICANFTSLDLKFAHIKGTHATIWRKTRLEIQVGRHILASMPGFMQHKLSIHTANKFQSLTSRLFTSQHLTSRTPLILYYHSGMWKNIWIIPARYTPRFGGAMLESIRRKFYLFVQSDNEIIPMSFRGRYELIMHVMVFVGPFNTQAHLPFTV